MGEAGPSGPRCPDPLGTAARQWASRRPGAHHVDEHGTCPAKRKRARSSQTDRPTIVGPRLRHRLVGVRHLIQSDDSTRSASCSRRGTRCYSPRLPSGPYVTARGTVGHLPGSTGASQGPPAVSGATRRRCSTWNIGRCAARQLAPAGACEAHRVGSWGRRVGSWDRHKGPRCSGPRSRWAHCRRNGRAMIGHHPIISRLDRPSERGSARPARGAR